MTATDPRAHCRSCGAFIIWAVTDTKRIPLDAEPTSDGNLEIVSEINGTPVVRYLELHEAIPTNPHRYRTHFVTCPQANQWRRR